MWLKPWLNPTATVVFPSPSGVGVIADTTTYFARGRSAINSTARRSIFAAPVPYGSRQSSGIPASAAMSVKGRSVACRAMSRSDGNVPHPWAATFAHRQVHHPPDASMHQDGGDAHRRAHEGSVTPVGRARAAASPCPPGHDRPWRRRAAGDGAGVSQPRAMPSCRSASPARCSSTSARTPRVSRCCCTC